MPTMNSPVPNSTSSSSTNPSIDEGQEDISLLDILTFLGTYKIFIFVITLVFCLFSILVSLNMTPIFTGKTLLMPPQQQQNSAASALAGLASLGNLTGSALGPKSQDDMYIALMNSEKFQKPIIDRFDLKTRFKSTFLIDTRQTLGSKVRITNDKKSSLMSIEVDDPDPVFAADLANAYAQELSRFLGEMAITDAQQRRLYFANQIKKTQDDLANAETSYREIQQKSGLQIPSLQAESSVKEIAELHGQIAARELQLQAMNTYATVQNPEVKKLITELTAMRMHLQKLEQGAPSAPSTGKLQQGALLAYRNMKVQESILESLVKQFEFARVDEAKEGPLIQVVDVATPAERRTSPKRTAIVIVSTAGGFLLACLLAFLRHIYQTTAKTSSGLEKLQRFKRAWSFN